MPGKYQYDIELKSNVAKLLTDMKEVQDRLDTVEGKEYKIKLNVDEKKLSNVISNLEKMLDSLGKGTGDFKQFENLSKELSSIVSEVQNLSKVFGKVDDSGTKTLLSSIQNIDKSLSELSQHIINVNKNMSNIGGDTNGTVKQVENISNAYDNASKSAEKLVEAQSKIGNKSNISSENIVPIFDDSKEVSKIENIGDAIDGLLTDIKGLKHYTDEVFDSFDSNMFGSGIGENRLGNAAYFFDEKNMGDWQDIGEYSKYLTTWSANQVKLFDQTLGFTEEEIERIIKEFYSDLDDDMQEDYKFDLKNIMDDDLYDFRSKFGVELQDVMKSLGYDAIKSNSGEYAFYNTDKLIREVQVYDNEANKIIEVNNKVAQLIKETSSTASSTPPIEDVFQGDDKATTDASTTAIKEESQALEQVSTSAKDAASSKDKFANANKEVKTSAESSSTSLNEEKKKFENIGDSAEETKKKLDDVVFKPNTEGFDEIVSKLDIAKDKIEEISKITKSSVWSESQGEYLESYNIKYKNGTSEIRGESSNNKGSNVLRANEVAYDAKAIEQKAKAVKKLSDELEAYNKQVPKKPADGQRSDKFESFVQNYKNAIDEAQKYLDNLGDSPVTEEVKNKWESLIDAIKKAKEEMDSVPNADRGSDSLSRGKEIDTITKYLDKFTGISKQAKRELNGLLDQLQSGDPSVNVKKIHERFLELTVAERNAGREARNLFDIFKDKKIYSFIGQAASMFSFYDLVNVGREGFQTIRELDTALTEMKKVSDETTQSLKNYQSTTFDVGDSVGATAKTIQNSTADFLRLGESMDEAAKSAKTANILLNVSEFENIDEATESLISMSQAYKELEKNEIVDVANKLGNEFAISTDGIATALKDSASALKTAQNDFYEASALAVAANTVVQDPSKVGAGKFMPEYIVICRYLCISESSYIG